MRTVIDSSGCAPYPHGGASFDVTVPMTVQGVDLLSVVKALTDRVSELELKLAALSAPQALAQSTSVAAIEDAKAPDVIVSTETISEPVQTVLEAPVADPVVDSVEVEAPPVAAKQTKKSSK
jgi:hypothetical protein